MRVGTMFLGEVHAVDHESIQTKFFIFGIPLVPMTSIYSTADTGGGLQGIEIPLHGPSVLAGYTRLVSFVGALILFFMAFVVNTRKTDPRLIVAAIVVAAIWALSFFVLGRLSDDEKNRRRLLRAIVGVGAPPELLPERSRRDIEIKLEESWDRVGKGKSWRERLASGEAPPEELPLIFALAEFSRDRPAADEARGKIGLAAIGM